MVAISGLDLVFHEICNVLTRLHLWQREIMAPVLYLINCCVRSLSTKVVKIEDFGASFVEDQGVHALPVEGWVVPERRLERNEAVRVPAQHIPDRAAADGAHV